MGDDADERLDLLLDAWARQQRLDQGQADDMLHAIVGQAREPSLPVTWWTDLSRQVAAAVVLATAHPTTPFGMPGATTADAAA